MELKYTKIHDDAVLHPHAHPTDAGLDLMAMEEVLLEPSIPVKVGTGVSIEIPEGFTGLIWDKSSIGSMGVKTLGGVIDTGYTGEIIVTLINLTKGKILLPKGKKIAQIIIQRYEKIEPVFVDKLTGELPRGLGGFGSTGH